MLSNKQCRMSFFLSWLPSYYATPSCDICDTIDFLQIRLLSGSLRSGTGEQGGANDSNSPVRSQRPQNQPNLITPRTHNLTVLCSSVQRRHQLLIIALLFYYVININAFPLRRQDKAVTINATCNCTERR